MKIWKATLVLFYNMENEWELKFYFEPQDKLSHMLNKKEK